jgi:hypothetical protein
MGALLILPQKSSWSVRSRMIDPCLGAALKQRAAARVAHHHPAAPDHMSLGPLVAWPTDPGA